MGDLTKNFSTHEFACPCCGQAFMDKGFMFRLQRLREEYGKSFSPVKGGGYRCVNYAKSKCTAHREGKAIDPDIPKEDYFIFIKLAMKHGFTGIGVKNKKGHYQLHIDDALEIKGIRPRPYFWSY